MKRKQKPYEPPSLHIEKVYMESTLMVASIESELHEEHLNKSVNKETSLQYESSLLCIQEIRLTDEYTLDA